MLLISATFRAIILDHCALDGFDHTNFESNPPFMGTAAGRLGDNSFRDSRLGYNSLKVVVTVPNDDI